MIELGKQYRIKRTGSRYQAQQHWNGVWIDLAQDVLNLTLAKKTIDACRKEDAKKVKIEIIEY